eukprot:2206612-Prymnesium_polylepis.1
MRRRGGQAPAPAEEVSLEAGSVLVMAGLTQEVFEHELPLRPGDPHRISLTFRSIVAGYEAERDGYDPCTDKDAGKGKRKR